MLLRPVLTALSLVIVSSGCTPSSDTYAQNCATPLPHWKTKKDGIGHMQPVIPVMIAADGSITWFEERISSNQLNKYMHMTTGLEPPPRIILDVADDAPCLTVQRVRGIMDRAPICRGEWPECSEGQGWESFDERSFAE